MNARDVAVELATDLGWELIEDPSHYPGSLHFERPEPKQGFWRYVLDGPRHGVLDVVIPPKDPCVIRILDPKWDPNGMLWPDEGAEWDLRYPDSLSKLKIWLEKYSTTSSRRPAGPNRSWTGKLWSKIKAIFATRDTAWPNRWEPGAGDRRAL